MKVAVVGLGKIGLPLAVQIASRGHEVIGLDISAEVVALVNQARPPFPGEPGLEAGLAEQHANGRLRATTTPTTAVVGAAAVIIVVPLVVDELSHPDFAALDVATSAVAPHLSPGVLVSYETTLPIGTTRRRFLPVLERNAGLSAGIDLFVCHSPERVSSGRVFRDLRSYPKLVGGVDGPSGQVAVNFYEDALEFDQRPDLHRPNGVWDLGSAEAAEMAKLAETTYRDVNIAYANELALIAERDGLDVWAVIEACNSQPFSHIHQPGIAVGGHCIPVYPHFLLAGAPDARIPAVAREVNAMNPRRCVERLARALGELSGTTILIVGVAYRAGVKEHAFSGAFPIRDALIELGARPVAHDPMYTAEELAALGFAPWAPDQPFDGAIIHTPQSGDGIALDRPWPQLRAVLDGRHSGPSWVPSGVPIIQLGLANIDDTEGEI